MLDFTPKRVRLFKDMEGYPQDAWVCVVPPTWKTDKERSSRIAMCREMEAGAMELAAHEIWLSYGGASMSITVPKKDEDGKLQWTKDDDGNWLAATDTIEINDTEGELSEEEFFTLLDEVPAEVVSIWYNALMEVVPHWGMTFQQ